MKRTFTVLAVTGALVTGCYCFFGHDLRGWTPTDFPNSSSKIFPVNPDDGIFFLKDCLAGTVNPYETPQRHEYAGSATLSVVSCRSQASAIEMVGIYFMVLLCLAGGLALKTRMRDG
jgi:hypothetical protein